MDWLTQNWLWIVFAIGAVWLFRRGGLAGCGMGGHGSHGGNSGGAGSAPGGTSTSGDAMRSPGSFAGAAPEKTVDPVSGREVLTARALTAVYQGRVFYFESPETRQRFEAAPEQYTPSAAPAPQQHRHHGC
jgi:YHS domain-containing protein